MLPCYTAPVWTPLPLLRTTPASHHSCFAPSKVRSGPSTITVPSCPIPCSAGSTSRAEQGGWVGGSGLGRVCYGTSNKFPFLHCNLSTWYPYYVKHEARYDAKRYVVCRVAEPAQQGGEGSGGRAKA